MQMCMATIRCVNVVRGFMVLHICIMEEFCRKVLSSCVRAFCVSVQVPRWPFLGTWLFFLGTSRAGSPDDEALTTRGQGFVLPRTRLRCRECTSAGQEGASCK